MSNWTVHLKRGVPPVLLLGYDQFVSVSLRKMDKAAAVSASVDTESPDRPQRDVMDNLPSCWTVDPEQEVFC